MKQLFLLPTLFFCMQVLAQVKTVASETNIGLPIIASQQRAGIVKIGSGLNITADGTVSLASGTATISTIPYISDFATFSANVTAVMVTDSSRGGYFTLYNGKDAVDNGMLFGDALGRKWRRFTQGEKIFMSWYGLTPYNNYSVDVAPTIRKAVAYVIAHPQQFSTVTLDVCKENSWYLIGSQIALGGIRFEGSGGRDRHPGTMFQILAGIQPFDIRTEAANVSNIAVRHYAGNPLDSFNHSFKIRAFVKFENVQVISNPNGNGFDISGCGPALSTAKDGIFGNPDHSIFINCQASDCLNGAELKGCDANAILFQSCNFSQNRKWGVFDNGFLGNTYLTTHWASNSQVNNSGSRVGDTTFYPYPDSVYNIVGKYPPTHRTYWYKTNFTGSNEQWNKTRKYWGGGPLWANNPNSNHAIISCYTEDFQANSIISPRSAWYEGTSGSPVVGGMWQHTFGGNTFFTGAGIQSKRVNTDALVFPSTVNGGLAESEFFKDPATTGSQRFMLPNETGTMALTSIKDLPRDPTAADIPNNTSRVWFNSKTGTVRHYVNLQGKLLVLSEYKEK